MAGIAEARLRAALVRRPGLACWGLGAVRGAALYVYDSTGSTLATGTMFLARLVPRALLGSFAGVFTDRSDRKRVLVVANLLLVLALAPMLVGVRSEALWLVYVAAALTSLLQQFVTPAEDTLLPRLVDGLDDLVPANALNALNNNLARLGGPLAGALIYGAWGLSGIVIVDAVSFLVAALLISRIRADGRPLRAGDVEEMSPWVARWREWLAGMGLARTHPAVAVGLIFTALAGLGEGVLGALLVPFARDVLLADDFTYGALLGSQAIGALVGGIIIGRFGPATSPVLLWGLGALGLAGFDAAIFLSPPYVPGAMLALVLFFAVGVPVSAMLVGSATVRQTSIPDAFRGRVIGSQQSLQALAMAAGTLAAGFLGELVAITPLLMAQVVVYALGGMVVLVVLRGNEHGRPSG